MDELDDLRRCPFCATIGILDEVESITWKRGKSVPVIKYVAQCPIRSCVGHHGKLYMDEQTAIDKWNMRDGIKPAEVTDEDLITENLRLMITSAIESSRK